MTEPNFEIRDERFFDIVARDTGLQKIASGFTFTEGPIWHPTEHWLVFSDIAESRQYRWSQIDGIAPFRIPSNQTNGNCFDLAGNIVSCEHASSTVTRHTHSGKVIEILASHFDGKELNSPNDIVCDSKGRLWFTDPYFGRKREDLGILRDQELDFQGVYRLDPDGSLRCVVKDFQQPNGLCFSLNEKTLFINDSFGPTIRKFNVNDDGTLTDGDVWATLTGKGKWVPDGMKVDVSGNLFCNGPGGVHVFDQNAICLGVVLVPEKSTNFCFGDIDRSTLYITASTSLYSIKTNTSGPAMIHSA